MRARAQQRNDANNNNNGADCAAQATALDAKVWEAASELALQREADSSTFEAAHRALVQALSADKDRRDPDCKEGTGKGWNARKTWHGFDCISIAPGSDEGERASKVFHLKDGARRRVLVGTIDQHGKRTDKWMTTSSSPPPVQPFIPVPDSAERPQHAQR